MKNQHGSKKSPLVKINLEHLKTLKVAGKITPGDCKTFRKKVADIKKLNLAEFKQSSFKPRKWQGKPPGKIPTDLDKAIIDNGLFRIDLNKKFRIFAYMKDEIIFVIWLDPRHRTGA